MAWTDNYRLNSYKIYMTTFNRVDRGELTGFVSGDITYNYNSDMRQIATIRTRNDNYIDFSLLRIVVETNTGNTCEMGTFMVADVKETHKENVVIRDYDLKSVLYGQQTNLFLGPQLLQGTNSFKARLEAVANPNTNFYRWTAPDSVKYKNYNFPGDGTTLNAGTSVYEFFQTMAEAYNLIIRIDGDTIVFENYVRPYDKPSEFEFTQDNGTIEGDVVVTKDKFSNINCVLAEYNNNNVSLRTFAVLPQSDPQSAQNRDHYVVGKLSCKTLNPETIEQLQIKAQQDLKRKYNPQDTLEFTGLFVGLLCGHCVNVTYYDVDTLQDTNTKGIIQEMRVSLTPSMKTQYKIKEANPNE